MALKTIKAMLKETIGLHARTVGDASIERAILHRMQALKMERDQDYLRKLREDGNELDELIEEVVVPETWFFRNVSPFEALSSYLPILRQAQAAKADAELKILSLPCSTGEEPYSIAMVLLEMETPVRHFSIDALDVSRRAIRKARRAIYGKNSFREEYSDLRDKYFERTRAGFQLCAEVKSHVSFSRANIIANDDLDQVRDKYDVIFCRNLLIYFDRPTQARVVEKLHRMLHPQGVLFVGHAEAAQVSKRYFQAIDVPLSFAFQKRPAGDEEPAPPPSSRPRPRKRRSDANRTVRELQDTFDSLVGLVEKDRRIGSQLSRSRVRDGQQSAASRQRSQKSPAAAKRSAQPLSTRREEAVEVQERVAEYLDLGRLGDAADLCETWIRQTPASADAHYYLGLISHLEGSPGAAESLLKKALYLDPNHHRAIGLLAFLAEQRGDGRSAADYRRRQERAISRHATDPGSKRDES